jgi:hypothetical protein
MPGITADFHPRGGPSPGSNFNVHAHLQLNGEAAPMPLLDPQVTAKIGTLQSLDDAIAFPPEQAETQFYGRQDRAICLIPVVQKKHNDHQGYEAHYQ